MGEVNAHLGKLCEWALTNNLPMFSAWVAPSGARPPGKLSGSSRKGFLRCATDLGMNPGTSEVEQDAFIEAHRERIRDWARMAQ
jgi:hypothetical protein